MKSFFLICLILSGISVCGFSFSAHSAPSPGISTEIIKPAVKTIGIWTHHHFLTGAQPKGPSGIDLGLDVSLFKPADDFSKVSGALGGSGFSSIGGGVLPMARIRGRKGLGEWVDISLGAITTLSLIGKPGWKVIGGGISAPFHKPSQGPVFGGRIGYTFSKISNFTTHTISPELVVSKPLPFAEPYGGIGAQYVIGKFEIEREVAGKTFTFKEGRKAFAYSAFVGIKLELALMVAVEMAYNSEGMPWMTAKVGFSI